MKKVKEYLDKNMFAVGDSTCDVKKNGHFFVGGTWIYPADWNPNLNDEELNNLSLGNHICKDHISVDINNETIIVGNISVNGAWSKYDYLQTYEHIPRGEPDDNGYYARSTEDEIIKYIDEYFLLIKQNLKK